MNGPPDMPTADPDLTLLLRPGRRAEFTLAELWMFAYEAVLGVSAAKLLAVARDCGWTGRGSCLVLASLAAKLAR